MSKVRSTLHSRPWLAPAGAAALALLLLLVPVSYEVTSGYTVRFRLDAPATSDDLGRLAARLGTALGTEHVAVSRSSLGKGPELLASVPSADREAIENAARLFATDLSRRGLSSELEIRPVHTLVSRNLYAMGFGRALQLDIRKFGRSGTDIERDLEQQLQTSGVSNARVSYLERGGCSLVQIVVPGEGAPGEATPASGIDVALICSGSGPQCPASCSGPAAANCSRAGSATCPMTSDVKVSVDGRQSGFVCTAEASLPSVAGMSDDEISRALAGQFQARGVEAEVVVRGGQVVSVNPHCKK